MFSNLTLAVIDFGRHVAHNATTNTRIAMYAAFVVMGLSLVTQMFAQPSGAVQALLFMLPALSGIVIRVARALDWAIDRFWALLVALPFTVGAAALFLWAANDANSTRLTGWVAYGDRIYLAQSTVFEIYIALAVMSALIALALVRPVLFAYHESRLRPATSRA